MPEGGDAGSIPAGSAGECTWTITTSNSFVYGNIIVRSGCLGVYVQGGENNFIENNIIVDASESAAHFADAAWLQPQMEGFMTGNRFSRNIFYSTKR